ncbi:hypothetical protein CEXT_58221 [Caerostris extrusa]|uniref:Uncharacterized protein n=1 Tax=Caerostris extrusa TaxID=172846 RepID=A0AAV4MEQ0_CAEEX|nr:hypothetical protein CEXT_58221 [Caerostris extrusa]
MTDSFSVKDLKSFPQLFTPAWKSLFIMFKNPLNILCLIHFICALSNSLEYSKTPVGDLREDLPECQIQKHDVPSTRPGTVETLSKETFTSMEEKDALLHEVTVGFPNKKSSNLRI